jgi:hypothetical protein
MQFSPVTASHLSTNILCKIWGFSAPYSMFALFLCCDRPSFTLIENSMLKDCIKFWGLLCRGMPLICCSLLLIQYIYSCHPYMEVIFLLCNLRILHAMLRRGTVNTKSLHTKIYNWILSIFFHIWCPWYYFSVMKSISALSMATCVNCTCSFCDWQYHSDSVFFLVYPLCLVFVQCVSCFMCAWCMQQVSGTKLPHKSHL